MPKRNLSGIVTRNKQPISVEFIPLREISPSEWRLLAQTFKLIEKYGALGGHTAQGSGVIKITKNTLEEGIDPALSSFKRLDAPSGSDQAMLYDLKNLSFWKFKVKLSPEIKKFWVRTNCG